LLNKFKFTKGLNSGNYFESTASLNIREEVIFSGKAHVDWSQPSWKRL